ncbi:hypothetical protein ADP71_04320 [Vitreoscilla sp. C1]|uniref:DUF4097 family beta strand repeat-containing protein n=1 Tax=Vitreoscilla sp. (strain C1) TaxID=96942 RepID=UPI000CDC55AC|nr:DUF4097 family beta strand repeat-containing protein [Vitreoscilla sp. C1]AUZ04229.1 hypothetical protein ADP71_04320 [Vitreoscilla sp. C1]
MKKLIALTVFLLAANVAMANETCSSSIKNRTIQGDVRISGSCSLSEVNVRGDVIILPGATLTLTNSVVDGDVESRNRFKEVVMIKNTINGDVDLERGTRVRLVENTVHGNVDLEYTSGEAEFDRNRISGDLKIDKGQTSRLNANTISGDLELERNTGRLLLSGNHVSGDLECKRNSQNPTGNQNQVTGRKMGQCSNM